MNKTRTMNDYVYIAVMLTLVVILIFFFVYKKLGSPDIFTCKIYEKWGIYCPGCGCTRALISLIQGDIIKSVRYNPTVLYSVVTTGVYVISTTVAKILKKEDSKYIMKYNPIYIYIGIAILIITCIVKNILY